MQTNAASPNPTKRTWKPDWYRWKTGEECPFCKEGRPEKRDVGTRFYAGQRTDAYLLHGHRSLGSTLVIWRGRHICDPVEMSSDELFEYWREVRDVGRAIRRRYETITLDYGTAGTGVPHLHTVITARYSDDPEPNAPLAWTQGAPQLGEAQFRHEVTVLGILMAEQG